MEDVLELLMYLTVLKRILGVYLTVGAIIFLSRPRNSIEADSHRYLTLALDSSMLFTSITDDGPSPYTPRLLNLLSVHNIKATFFIVGSRAISRPQMIQTEYMQGHQLSVHTWA